MTTHFVGQRVRVNCFGSRHHGEEVVILRVNVPAWSLGRRYMGHEVSAPCAGGYTYCIFEPHELEPILPSGHTAGQEGVCEELDKLLTGVVA